MKTLMLSLLLPAALLLGAGTMTVDGVEFVYRAPAGTTQPKRIMVLFGGRNWPGENTLRTFRFDALADRHGLILVSPSFRDRDYWQPEEWSGPTLKRAVAELERLYRLKPEKLCFYGYSAGGQCANLFYAYMPERVTAWGAHGCGVYFSGKIPDPAPALVTCGTEDADRWRISHTFLANYRENGGTLLWKYNRKDHGLSPDALELARAWFDAILSGESAQFAAEDDSHEVVPIGEADRIDCELRNEIPNRRILELWLK